MCGGSIRKTHARSKVNPTARSQPNQPKTPSTTPHVRFFLQTASFFECSPRLVGLLHILHLFTSAHRLFATTGGRAQAERTMEQLEKPRGPMRGPHESARILTGWIRLVLLTPSSTVFPITPSLAPNSTPNCKAESLWRRSSCARSSKAQDS